MPAGPPAGAGVAALRGGDLPGVAPAQEDPAGVEADDLHQGLARPLEEIGRPDSALQDAQGARHPFEQRT